MTVFDMESNDQQLLNMGFLLFQIKETNLIEPL